jgi:hypothetical protein
MRWNEAVDVATHYLIGYVGLIGPLDCTGDL